MPEARPSGSAVLFRATLLRYPMGPFPVSCRSQFHGGDFTGQFDLGDDPASRVRGKRQATLVAVERREPRARVGQAHTGAKTIRKSDAVVDHGHAKAFGQMFSPDGNRSTLRQ